MVELFTPEQLREILASYDRIDQLVEPALAEPKDSGPSVPSRLQGPMALRVVSA